MVIDFICSQKAKAKQDSSWRVDFCYSRVLCINPKILPLFRNGQEANTLLELWSRVFPGGCSTNYRDGCFLDQP